MEVCKNLYVFNEHIYIILQFQHCDQTICIYKVFYEDLPIVIYFQHEWNSGFLPELSHSQNIQIVSED